jgi:hypothetical protein
MNNSSLSIPAVRSNYAGATRCTYDLPVVVVEGEHASSALHVTGPIRAAKRCDLGPQTQCRHRALRAKIGPKPPLTRNPEQVTMLWVTLGMTGITPYCKSCFLEYRRRKSAIQYILPSHRTV